MMMAGLPINKLQTPTSVVYLDYDPTVGLPPRPQGWTRFVCISDTHSRAFPVPSGDVLLHSGDLTKYGRLPEFQSTMRWLYNLPHPMKIVIAGNHDFPLHGDWYDANHSLFKSHDTHKVNRIDVLKMLQGPDAQRAGIVYLQNRRFEFRTSPNGRVWSVHGSPWTPYFDGWAFNYERGPEAEELYRLVKPCDILLTHGPPYSILDLAQERTPVGCESLLNALPRIRPRLHVFGHIHEGRGAQIRQYMNDGSLSPLSHSPLTSGPISPISQSPGTGNGMGAVPTSRHAIFVNASNAPAGSNSVWMDGSPKQFGDYGFQPIVVDLLDAVF